MRLGVVGALLCTFLSVVARASAINKLHWPLRNGGEIQRNARPSGYCNCIHKTRAKESMHRRKCEQLTRPVPRFKARLIGPPSSQTTRTHVLLKGQRLSTTTREIPLPNTKYNAEIFYEPVQYLNYHLPQHYHNQDQLIFKSQNFPKQTPEYNRGDLKIRTHRRRNNGDAFEEQDISNSRKSLHGISLFLDIDAEIPTTKDSQGLEELTKIPRIDESQYSLYECLDFQLAHNHCNFILPGAQIWKDSKNNCNEIDKILRENREFIQNDYSQNEYNPGKYSKVLKSQNEYELLTNEQNNNEELENFMLLNNIILKEINTQNKIKTLQSTFTKPVLEFLHQTGIQQSENKNFEGLEPNDRNLFDFTKIGNENKILEHIHSQCKSVDTVLFGSKTLTDKPMEIQNFIRSGNRKHLSPNPDNDKTNYVELKEIENISNKMQIMTKYYILGEIQKSCKELDNILFQNRKMDQGVRIINSEQLESAVTRPPLEYLPHRVGLVSYYEESTDSEISDSFDKEYVERYQGQKDKSAFDKQAIDSDTQSKGINELLFPYKIYGQNVFKNDSQEDVTVSQETTTKIPHYRNLDDETTSKNSNGYDYYDDVVNVTTTTYEPTIYKAIDWFRSIGENNNGAPTYTTEEGMSISTTVTGFQHFNSENIPESSCTALNCTDGPMTVLNTTTLSPQVADVTELIDFTTNNDHTECTYPEVTTKTVILKEASGSETDSTPSAHNRDSYTSTINVTDELEENNNYNLTTESLMRLTGVYTDFTTPATEYRPNIKEINIEIPKLESLEWKNGSLSSRVDGYEHLPNDDFLNLTQAHYKKSGVDSNVNKSVLLQVLSGKIMFVSNRHNIPLHFLQNTNGDVDLGIDGNYICKHLIDDLHKSVILSVLCNNTLSLYLNR